MSEVNRIRTEAGPDTRGVSHGSGGGAGRKKASRVVDGMAVDRVSRGTAVVAWLVLFFMMIPSLVVIPMSFGDRNEFVFPPESFSLFLYKEYFFTSTWMSTTVQSFKVAALTTVLSLTLGVSAAYGVVRSEFPGKQWIILLLLTPMLIPVIVIALGLNIYFSFLNISGTTTAIVLGHTLVVTPFVIILVMAALRHVDPNLEAAARVMGASRLRTVFKVTLPLLKPALVTSSLFAFLLSFDEVVISLFVSGRNSQTLPVKMYDNIRWEISPVLAAISTLLTVLALAACIAAVLYEKHEEAEK
jgi:putative spermidine/putrescine transport system permease protein